jgi:hypothetical protein
VLQVWSLLLSDSEFFLLNTFGYRWLTREKVLLKSKSPNQFMSCNLLRMMLQSPENDVRSVFGISLSLVLFSWSNDQITKCFMFLLVTLLTMFFLFRNIILLILVMVKPLMRMGVMRMEVTVSRAPELILLWVFGIFIYSTCMVNFCLQVSMFALHV